MENEYRFELLELLNKNFPNEINVRPFINEHRDKGVSRQAFSQLFHSWRENKFAFLSDFISLSLSRQGMYDDETDIMVKLLPNGVEEYHRLKNIYYPPLPDNKEELKLAKKGIVISKQTLIWTIIGVIILIAVNILLALHVI